MLNAFTGVRVDELVAGYIVLEVVRNDPVGGVPRVVGGRAISRPDRARHDVTSARVPDRVSGYGRDGMVGWMVVSMQNKFLLRVHALPQFLRCILIHNKRNGSDSYTRHQIFSNTYTCML